MARPYHALLTVCLPKYTLGLVWDSRPAWWSYHLDRMGFSAFLGHVHIYAIERSKPHWEGRQIKWVTFGQAD